MMSHLVFLTLAILVSRPVLGAFFGGSDSSAAEPPASTDSSPPDPSASATKSSSSSDASSGGSSGSTNTSSEVDYLLTLQAAQISSMTCLITLVNMTSQPIGTCLGMTTLADLLVESPTPSNSTAKSGKSFSSQLESYLTTTCSASQCTSEQIEDAKGQLKGGCTPNGDTGLIKGYMAVLENYETSYRTLGCSVHYNGTSDNCLPAALNESQAANTPQFFASLISGSGSDLTQYQQSVFASASCTGCIYEMYKAAVYLISAIRGNALTTSFGDHLKNDCANDKSTGDTLKWADVEDQQIPDALQVQQSTGSPSCATRVELWSTLRITGLGLVWVGLGVGGWLGVWRRF